MIEYPPALDAAKAARLQQNRPLNKYESPVIHPTALAAREEQCRTALVPSRMSNAVPILPPRLASIARLHTLQGQT